MPGRSDQTGRVRRDGKSAREKNFRADKIAKRIEEKAKRKKQESGDIAQLVERLNGIQEVMGSIPTISTKRNLKRTTVK